MAKPTMDAAARRSARRVRDAGRRNAARRETEARSVARKLNHREFCEFLEEMRLRGITLDHARALRIFVEEGGEE